MENKASKKIKWLIVVILLLFLIPSGVDFVDGFFEGWTAAERGMALAEDGGNGHFQSFYVRIEPTGDDYLVKSIGDGYKFVTFRETGELVMTKKVSSVWWVMVLRVLLSFTVVIALIVFIVQLFRFSTKITKRRVMAEENIGSLRRLANTLLIFSFGGYLIQMIETIWVCSHVSLEGYKIVMPMPPAALIVALIILVMTEILKLGHKLQQEQDLTI